MINPLEVTFHDLDHNPKIEKIIQEKFLSLQSVTPDITKCHVVVEKLSKHHQTANTSCVRLDVKIPHFEDIIVSEKCDEDDAALMTNVIKVFKRTKQLVREGLKRRQDQHRVPREDKFAVVEAEADSDEDIL